MAYAIVNGIRIHYEVTGAGDAALLLNGLGAPAASWALQVKALAPHFRVVTLDNRGVGESDLPPDPVYTTAGSRRSSSGFSTCFLCMSWHGCCFTTPSIRCWRR